MSRVIIHRSSIPLIGSGGNTPNTDPMFNKHIVYKLEENIPSVVPSVPDPADVQADIGDESIILYEYANGFIRFIYDLDTNSWGAPFVNPKFAPGHLDT